MSIADFDYASTHPGEGVAVQVGPERRRLHRLAEVRRLQGVSRRTMARRLETDVAEIKRQENASSDLMLSELYRWQAALDVPLAELFAESEETLSTPVLKRAQLVRLMKTVMAILERSQQASIRRMAETLVVQLTELMPELRGINPWHSVGRRRSQNEVGQAAERRISTHIFRILADE